MKTKKQSPILFSTPMVQAILNGTKTMTRRIVTPQPEMMPQSFPVPVDEFIKQLKTQTKKGFKTLCSTGPCNGMVVPECKFGEVGDLIWVRETIREYECYIDGAPHCGQGYEFKASPHECDYCHDENRKWKPSIYMPKAACRIWLEITSIRIERLNSISESDAIAEGIEESLWDEVNKCRVFKYYGYANAVTDAIESFKSLWQSINGKESWKENPFVWVIEFKRVEKPC